MSSRLLTVSLVSAFLLAGLASRLVAQQPVGRPMPLPPAPIRCASCPQTEPEVVLQVRVLNMPSDYLDRCFNSMGLRTSRACGTCPEGCPASTGNHKSMVIVSDRELAKLMNLIQSDPRVNVQCMPQIKVDNGQRGQVCITDEQYFVTEIREKKVDGRTMLVPHAQAFPTGCWMELQPQVSADGKQVELNVACELKCLETVPVPTFPVTTFITPILEGGAIGAPVPFTQFLQQPKFDVHRVDTTVVLPREQTVVISAGQMNRAIEKESCVPVLCDIPGLAELFRTKTMRPEKMDVMVLVTPQVLTPKKAMERIAGHDLPSLLRVVHTEAALQADWLPGCCDEAMIEEVPAQQAKACGACPACCDAQVCSLVKQYEAACASGQSAEATKLAVQALALDPTCFSKCRACCQPK